MPETKDLIMDERIVWDSKSLKQVDEAKQRILELKRTGHEIFLSDGKTPMKRFCSNYEEVVARAKKVAAGLGLMKILTEKGDERLTWDKENGPEAMEAKKKFNEFIGKGYKAFSVDARGKKNRRIHEFDIDAEEILMVPKTVKG